MGGSAQVIAFLEWIVVLTVYSVIGFWAYVFVQATRLLAKAIWR